jgi:polyisoprenoid-binding protein YceI
MQHTLTTQLEIKSDILYNDTTKGGNHLFISAIFIIFSTLSMYSLAANSSEKISVDAKNSEVSFTGEHVGMQFKGVFKEWSAELVLPPAESPKITAIFKVKSAKTGDSTYDGTLPEGDWFDVKNHPEGKFESTEILSKGSDYAVKGSLTLRGVSAPVSFVLVRVADKLNATFDIDRLAYKIGIESDPDAEWVSRNIQMRLSLSIK